MNRTMDMLHRVLKWADHNRASAVALMLCAAAAMGVVGCGSMIEAFIVPSDDTGLQRVPLYDDDGDAIPDAMGYANDDGTKVIDPDTGKPAEVPGSREKMNAAGGIDKSLARICGIAGLLGVPGLMKLGQHIGKLKPTKRFTGVVNTMQAVREAAKAAKAEGKSGLTIEQIDKIAVEANAQVAGLEAAVTMTKAEQKAKRAPRDAAAA